MVRRIRYDFFLVILCSLLIACGGGGGGGGGSAGVATGTGVFVDSSVAGLKYVSGSISGVTDSNGTFTYEVGQTIRFYVGDILIGETTPKAILTPKDLVSGATVNNPIVLKIARFLMSLDADNNPTNGILIPTSVENNAKGKTIDFATVNDTTLDGLIIQITGKSTVVTATEAQTHLTNTILNLFAGIYSGTYSGADSGTWEVTIDGSGNITGSGKSNSQILFGITGSVNANGNMALTASGAAGEATYSGTLDVTTGIVSGTWQFVPPPGGGTFSGNKITGIRVSISPSAISVGAAGNQQFAATVTGSLNQSVTWGVQEGSAGGTITSGGLYTAPSTPGIYHVVATSEADNSRSATATVTVTSVGDTIPPTLESSNPPNGAQNVPLTLSFISFSFSEAMGPGYSVNWGGLDTSYFSTPTWSGDKKTITFPLIKSLPSSTTVSWVLTGSSQPGYFADLAGNPLTPNSVSGSFTTASTGTGNLPLVVIGGADSITSNSMRLVMSTVLSTNLPAVGYYEYSTDPSFVGALRTPDVSISPGTVTYLTETITGLLPSTYYYFRAVATNAAGTSYSGTAYGVYGVGAVSTSTAAGWPVANTSFILTFSPNSAVLEGIFTSTSLPAVIYFEYDTDLNFTNALRTPDQAINATGGEPFGFVSRTATVTGLSPATDYYYRAVATNSTGTSIGLVQYFKTAP